MALVASVKFEPWSFLLQELSKYIFTTHICPVLRVLPFQFAFHRFMTSFSTLTRTNQCTLEGVGLMALKIAKNFQSDLLLLDTFMCYCLHSAVNILPYIMLSYTESDFALWQWGDLLLPLCLFLNRHIRLIWKSIATIFTYIADILYKTPWIGLPLLILNN